MADTPKRVYGPAQLAGTAATVYTVPADTVFILRYVRVTNTTGTDRTFTLSIGTDAADKRLFSAVTVAASGGSMDWAGFVPVAAAEVIQAYASAATALTVVIAGIEVT